MLVMLGCLVCMLGIIVYGAVAILLYSILVPDMAGDDSLFQTEEQVATWCTLWPLLAVAMVLVALWNVGVMGYTLIRSIW